MIIPWAAKRSKIAELYKKLLRNVEGIKFQEALKDTKSVNWMFCILLDNFKLSRDKLIEKLEKNEIETRPLFYPLNEMPPFSVKSIFPNSKFISYNGLSLPTYAELIGADIEYICGVIKNKSWKI